jgi:hypothetical protein
MLVWGHTSAYTPSAVLDGIAGFDQRVACVFSACLLRGVYEAFHRAPDHVLDEACHLVVLVVFVSSVLKNILSVQSILHNSIRTKLIKQKGQ